MVVDYIKEVMRSLKLKKKRFPIFASKWFNLELVGLIRMTSTLNLMPKRFSKTFANPVNGFECKSG